MFQGNYTFATKNQCRSFIPSRSDDIQAAFHILIYLLNDGSLPWLGDTFKKGRKDLREIIRERTRKQYVKDLADMVPQQV